MVGGAGRGVIGSGLNILLWLLVMGFVLGWEGWGVNRVCLFGGRFSVSFVYVQSM